MDVEFWKTAWDEGRIGFHRGEFHPELLKYFPLLEIQGEQSILVPLCGKTLDITWLSHQNLYVTGVELCQKAVLEYFQDHSIENYEVQNNSYTHQNITLEVGDFFHHQKEGGYDYIYDRAAIVALPPQMRIEYAKKCLELLKPKGRSLLIAFEYDQTKVQGPPFSVEEAEIYQLFGNEAQIDLLDTQSSQPKNQKFVEAGLNKFTQKTYLISKN
jgi:thiopurine S-methyltransferase